VAEDYKYRLHKAQANNNQQYTKIIGQKALQEAGLNGTWT
jgi:hypothetical protein